MKGQGEDNTGMDPRLLEDRFQNGHMLAIYWETVGRWVMMRAVRDALALQTPLYLLQAADASSPPMTRELAAKLMNHYCPLETGGMHSMLPVHAGMRKRLLDTLDKTKGLVKNAEGVVVHVVLNPKDEEAVALVAAGLAAQRTIYLRHINFI